MKILPTKDAVKKFLLSLPNSQTTVGLVPTMGALHEGHLDLVRKAKENSDIVIVSIFVNPTQFNNPDDFAKYPKTLDKDLDLLKNIGVDAVFVPDNQEVYPESPLIKIDFGDLERVLEGSFRPGHFNGVGIVVSKLLNIVKPHKAYFGQKDLQQVAVIKRLVKDLSFDVEIIVVPTVREASGLALSSRNLRLSPVQRENALVLYKSLSFAKTELLKGESWFTIKSEVENQFQQTPEVELEYFELVDSDKMTVLESLQEGISLSICTAAYVGDVRLIDNISVNH
ncbi:pantoate--beta-alanine ligase [Cecembia rubra]|uniref:Pantothenate synthetase n=1 Tax=Cecembia rubra TaxID=1485585 RepID=A0A2P8E0G7_9BACT|nr:pantoate--beta-alanine ligase [Cecembia rubra]PSL02962.1 pantothenate synthetase [Cecembia rubra]